MPIEIKVPEVGESITEVEIGGWLKAKGDRVEKDEAIVALESDKATVELPSPVAGTIGDILKKKGETARVGEVIGFLEKGPGKGQPSAHADQPSAPRAEVKPESKVEPPKPASLSQGPRVPIVMPGAQRVLDEHGLRAEAVKGTGTGGRVLKEDVLGHLQQIEGTLQPGPAPETKASPPQAASIASSNPAGREEDTVPMTRLRRTLAERLVQVQQTAAMLTTFNEVDMSGVMALRKEYGEAFQKKYNVKLGFMSFFVKACVDGLKQCPEINAEIRGNNIVYRNYYDIGVAIGGGKGLVVPVLRNAERLSFAEIEMAVGELAGRAKDNKLKIEELQGGTFTISNGGVYGSLLSTPILNPPQSGILGMHSIQERPVAREGIVMIRPMMYLALTYDHRIVDGREAVTFLRRIKEAVESPARMLIEV